MSSLWWVVGNEAKDERRRMIKRLNEFSGNTIEMRIKLKLI